MKPLFRLVVASVTGLFIGWVIQHFRGIDPRPLADIPPERMAGPRPATLHHSQPQWQVWLDANAPIQPVLDAGDFWERMSSVGSGTTIERDLAFEEAFFSLPPAAILKILADEKFSEFPRLYEAEQSTLWSRKLLSIGLDKALGMAGRMPALWLNAHLEHALMDSLAREDPERGFEWLTQSTNGDQRTLAEYLEHVAEYDVDKAGSLYVGLNASIHRYAVSKLLKKMGSKDWRKAETWGKQHLAPEEWKSAAQSVFEDYTGPRIAELKEIGDQTEDPALRSAAYSRSVFWPVASCGETLDRALALPAGSLDPGGWQEVATTCAMDNRRSPDPVAGEEELRLLFQRVPEEVQATFRETVIQTVCLNDEPLGARFYETLKPDEVTQLANSWTRKDPAAASGWIATLPPSDKREAAVLAFCRETTPVDPAGAAAWASTLTDPQQRRSAVQDALAVWRQTEPAAAEDWAEANNTTGLR